MIAEIVSNGMLSLPAALAVVGIVPGIILIAFLGIFALYTSLVLVDFKLRHPQVHNMGDAGLILGGPILREILAAGTVIFAVCATGSQLLAGQITLSTLSGNKLCLMLYTGIFTIPTLLLSFPRTLDQLSMLSIVSCFCILVAGVVGMSAAGSLESPKPIKITASASFYGMEVPQLLQLPTDLIRRCFPRNYQPRFRVRRPLHVLHPHIGNEATTRCKKGCLDTTSLRNNLLLRLRGRHVHLPRQRRNVSGFLFSASKMGESNIRPCARELLDRRIIVLAHRCQAVLHQAVSESSAASA